MISQKKGLNLKLEILRKKAATKSKKGWESFLINMKKNLKYYLKDKLTEKELQLVPTSFDVVGDILIFSDFPKELARKEKMIGEVILKTHAYIKTVLKKTRKYSGKFRTAKLKVIAGEEKKETICRENNVLVKLDVEKVYFSVRMSSERLRISKLIKPNENIIF